MTSKIWRQPSGVTSSAGLCSQVPALLTKISIGPSSDSIVSSIGSMAFTSVTSAPTDMAFPPASRMAAATFSALSTRRATMATAAPASASACARASPIPPLPPVTTATLPVRSNFDITVMNYSSYGFAAF